MLTIKCLLIVPNPESALNEEAGKLLLERYDDYCSRAKLFTEIHARITIDSQDNRNNQETHILETGSDLNRERNDTMNNKKQLVNSSDRKKKDKTLKESKKKLKRL